MLKIIKKIKDIKSLLLDKLDEIIRRNDEITASLAKINNNLDTINANLLERNERLIRLEEEKKRNEPEKQKTSQYWSKKPQYGNNWYSFPITSNYIIESITGQTEKTLTEWAIDNYLGNVPIEKLLVVCCGHGNKERNLAKTNLFKHCDAYDISEGAISSAKQLAIEAGVADKIHYGVMDFNSPLLPSNEYDLIICNGALHHIENLEKCLAALYDSLKTGGWLWASEFTGPSRYRYSPEEIALINEAKKLIPNELGGSNLFHPKQLQPKLDADPSESIRSSEIEAILKERFAYLEIRNYGGNILMRALDTQFFNNFNPDNQVHVDTVYKLIDFEKNVLKSGQRSHHAYFIARKS
jgi:2-polyprenyl-3-methyl-5-hydroxy-6-metoxy-1,4-benzoquinol methylase